MGAEESEIEEEVRVMRASKIKLALEEMSVPTKGVFEVRVDGEQKLAAEARIAVSCSFSACTCSIPALADRMRAQRKRNCLVHEVPVHF